MENPLYYAARLRCFFCVVVAFVVVVVSVDLASKYEFRCESLNGALFTCIASVLLPCLSLSVCLGVLTLLTCGTLSHSSATKRIKKEEKRRKLSSRLLCGEACMLLSSMDMCVCVFVLRLLPFMVRHATTG